MRSEQSKKQRIEHDRQATIHYGIKLNRQTDADLIGRIEDRKKAGIGVQTYIKRLIRRDIEENVNE